MLIGLVGVPNSGKSTFFKASTTIDVPIAPYPFTTIEPNQGMAHVISNCPCKELGVKCAPKNSLCIDGTRYIPVKLLDVAGLVPDAHKGRGLGNKFLDDLRQASALIHVLDCSGKTDAEGKEASEYCPGETIKMLEKEIDSWILGIITKGVKKGQKEDELIKSIAKQLSGLMITEEQVKEAYKKTHELSTLATEVRKISKPILIAANKMDLPKSKENFEKIKKDFPDKTTVPCSAEIEVALQMANKNEMIKYNNITGGFEITNKEKLNERQINGLNLIKNFLKEWNSTGIQECLNKTVFEFLNYIVVYPVEDENKFSDKKGNVLPDAYLVPKGTNAKQFAGFVHTDFEKNFIRAMDARTKMQVGAEHELKNNDVIKIFAGR